MTINRWQIVACVVVGIMSLAWNAVSAPPETEGAAAQTKEAPVVMSEKFKELKVLHYPERRESKGWVKKADGTLVAVDEGLEYQGTKFYLSFFFDLVAVDAKSGATRWEVEWSKRQPTWQSIAVMELDQAGQKSVVIEVRPAGAKPEQRSKFRYFQPKDGKELKFAWQDKSATESESDVPALTKRQTAE